MTVLSKIYTLKTDTKTAYFFIINLNTINMSDEEVIEFVLSLELGASKEGVEGALEEFKKDKENKNYEVGCY